MRELTTAKLFETALGIAPPWTVASVDFDESAKTLTVLIDFKPGSRFEVSGHAGAHPVHDTVTKNYRHLNFFQHECHLQVRAPRVKFDSAGAGSVSALPGFFGAGQGRAMRVDEAIEGPGQVYATTWEINA